MCLGLQDVFPEAMDLRPHHMSLDDVKGKPGAVRMEQISKQRTRIWRGTPRSGKTAGASMPTIVRGLVTGKEHTFGVIRNPYDFMATCFVRRGQTKTFEDFVKNFREAPYIEDGRIYYHSQDCTSLLRYENLQTELDALLEKLELPPCPVGRHNETQKKQPWETYYTPKTFAIMNERFGDEFDEFYERR
jgi:hypothetical protein